MTTAPAAAFGLPPTAPPSFGTRLLGIGAAQPDRTITAAELGAQFGRDADWVRARTGIEAVRRSTSAGEIGQLAAQASSIALRRAGLGAHDVDLVLTASCSLGRQTMSRIAGEVAPAAGWMAINAACSGFCFAIDPTRAPARLRRRAPYAGQVVRLS